MAHPSYLLMDPISQKMCMCILDSHIGLIPVWTSIRLQVKHKIMWFMSYSNYKYIYIYIYIGSETCVLRDKDTRTPSQSHFPTNKICTVNQTTHILIPKTKTVQVGPNANDQPEEQTK